MFRVETVLRSSINESKRINMEFAKILLTNYETNPQKSRINSLTKGSLSANLAQFSYKVTQKVFDKATVEASNLDKIDVRHY